MRECSTGESGGEATRGWVAPVFFNFFSLDRISLGTRKEVPPPYNFLMTREGGGEVKTRQVEPGGDGGVRGDEIFLPRSQEELMTFNFCNQHLIWLPGRFVQ